MPIDYRQEAPQLLLDFLSYHETIKAHSQRTVDEYFLDLRNFFRYLKQTRDPALRDVPMDQVSIRDVDRDLIASVTLTDIYGYMTYLSRDRVLHQNSQRSEKGLNAASRARKLATIRSFYGYLCNKVHVLEENPAAVEKILEEYEASINYTETNAQAEKDPAPLSDTGGEHGPFRQRRRP